MKGLASLTATALAKWAKPAQAIAYRGRVIERIPLLAEASSDWFAVHVQYRGQTVCTYGDTQRIFPLMSAIKPFVLLYLLEHYGAETVFEWVDVLPSELPFNSLEQLRLDRGRPRNPMINSGAIALAEKLPGKTPTERCETFCQWLNQRANCALWLDQAVLASVRLAGRGMNRAIADILFNHEQLVDPETTLDTYEQICCLSGRVADLAQMGDLLACEHSGVTPAHCQITTAVTFTCGLYEASANYAVRIGLPVKSGVSGALLAVVPGEGAIACYSPALDAVGNSLVGLAFLQAMSQDLRLSLFAQNKK